MIRKKLSPEDAGKYLNGARSMAKAHSQRLGQHLMNVLDPAGINPEIFYCEDEQKVEQWFYETWVEQ